LIQVRLDVFGSGLTAEELADAPHLAQRRFSSHPVVLCPHGICVLYGGGPPSSRFAFGLSRRHDFYVGLPVCARQPHHLREVPGAAGIGLGDGGADDVAVAAERGWGQSEADVNDQVTGNDYLCHNGPPGGASGLSSGGTASPEVVFHHMQGMAAV
jgi:hypothetical protein